MQLWANNKIRLLITGVCNAHCPHCHNEGVNENAKFIPLPLVEKIVTLAKRSGQPVTDATISGGEPLLHPKVVEIASLLAQVASRITLSTNASRLTPERAQALVKAGVSKFRIDLDPFRMTGKRWAVAGLNVPRLLKAVTVAKDAGAQVAFNTVLSTYSEEQLRLALSIAAENNIGIKCFERVLPDEHGIFRPAPDIPRILFDQIMESLFGRVQIVHDTQSGDITYSCTGFKVRYCELLCLHGSCGYTGTRIEPNGFVSACMNRLNGPRISIDETLDRTEEILTEAVSTGCVLGLNHG
jgi:cyclic pyranopterin phosphate synthase